MPFALLCGCLAHDYHLRGWPARRYESRNGRSGPAVRSPNISIADLLGLADSRSRRRKVHLLGAVQRRLDENPQAMP
jgi:hypothetical protein